jgi:dsDNA-specific endonuclease/ATPase MutS2
LHSFRENDFFEDEALIYPVVLNDIPEQELLISASDLKEAMTMKAQTDLQKRRPSPIAKEKHPQWIEVDLHINSLLDSTTGLTNTDMLNVQLDTFRKTMAEYKNKKGQKIIFIHGKGAGVLKNALLSELKLKYKHFPVQDASFKESGFGATMIPIK